MRIVKDLYPGQTISVDPAFPSGKARNESAPEARDGFPFEEKWVNDLLGWMQALVNAASITPDGTSERVGASQLLQAIEYIATHTTFADGATFDAAVQVNSTLGVSSSIATGGLITAGGGLTVFGQALLNGTFRIAQLAQLVSPVSVTRPQPLRPTFIGDASDSWPTAGVWEKRNDTFAWIQRSANGANIIFPIVDCPDGSTLTAVRMTVAGGVGPDGDYSALPSGKPVLRIRSVDASGAVTGHATDTTDPSGNVGDFNAVHTITNTLVTPITIDHGSDPLQIYAQLSGVAADFEADKFGILGLDAIFSAGQVNP